MIFFEALLIAESVFLLTVALLWLAGYLAEKYHNWRHPVLPHCSIDPLCHPSFVRDKYGVGRIGDVVVRSP